MRKFTLIIVKACLVLLSERTAGQPITLSVSNVPLDTVFSKIQDQSPYRFVYTNEELLGTKKVSFSVQKAPIEAVLGLSFKGQPVDYSMEDQYIYIRKKKETRKPIPLSMQTSEISGKITNEQGDPLEGATVELNKLGFRALTNAKGEFLLMNIPAGNYLLEITFIGYEKYATIAKSPANGRPLMISMKRSINNLDETVIKGYYNTTKRFNTGDVTTVKGEDIENQPVSDPILTLEGRVPGLYIRQISGIPGANSTASTNIFLRGINSIASGTAPLFVIDGVPFTSSTLTNSAIGGGAATLSPFNTINPADIESIEVLKDADATAIYGSRGANGVILITTKKGKSGKTKFDINAFAGDGKVSKMLPLLNTKQYLQMRHEAFNNDGTLPGATDYDLNGSWDTTRNTNWENVLIGGTAHYDKGEATISGGSLNTQFLLSGSYGKQTTVYPGNYYDQISSVHLNVNHLSSDKRFHINISSGYGNDYNVIPTSDFTQQITLAPDAPPLYIGENLNWQQNASGIFTFSNPLGSTLQSAVASTDNLISNALLSYNLLPCLTLSASLGFNKIEMNQNLIYPLASYTPAYASFTFLRKHNLANNDLKTWIIEPQLNFKKHIWKGELDAIVGTTIQENKQTGYSINTSDYPTDAAINNIAAAASVSIFGYNYTQYKYNAIFCRFGYNVDDKYLLNITARRDGSSRFGPGYQFGNFGALGAGWIFSHERFLKGKLKGLNFGKLRASYGTTGNDQILDYQYLSSYSSYDYPYQGLTGLYPTRIANPDYRWELVKKFELGLELGFLKNRISFGGNYYVNHTDNQLVGYSLPAQTGFNSVIANLPANIQNTGLEFNVSTINIIGKKFTWNTSANISFPRNKLVAYPNLSGSSYANTYTTKQSLFSRKGYQFAGVNPTTGLYQYEDLNKDGQITYPQDISAMKPVTQSFYGGVLNSLKYKSISLDVFIQFVNQNGYDYARSFARPGTMINQPVYVLARWQKPGDITDVQRFSEQNPAASSTFSKIGSSNYPITDASFIRLKNISLSYDFIFNNKVITAVKIYLQAQNLLTITQFKGLEPENSSGGLSLPTLRMVVGGIKISM